MAVVSLDEQVALMQKEKSETYQLHQVITGIDTDLCTDAANALRFAQHYKGQLLYVNGIGWHHYDSQRWKHDPHAASRLAQQMGCFIREESINHIQSASIPELTSNERKQAQDMGEALLKWAKSSEGSGRIGAMLQLAPGHMYIDAEALDTDHFKFNCANGTLDLISGNLRPANPDDLISKISPIEYEPSAACDEWERVVLDICCGDVDLMRYIQRVIGYSVTGDTSEQVMFVFNGKGSNGKDTVLGRVSKALGDYCGLAAGTLLVKPHGERHPTEITDLRSQRLVIASESSEGAKLFEAQVKLITGSDRLKGRRMGGDFYEFPNTSKIVLMTNHKPVIDGTDRGIWRRIQLIPFNQKYIPGKNLDKTLMDRLDANELPGILNWCIEGCKQWFEMGLHPPEIVRNTTKDYREEQDVLGDFFYEHCELKRTHQVTAKAFYKKYKAWCDDAGEQTLSQKKLWPRLEERGISRARQSGGYLYTGIGLNHENDAGY